VLMRFILDLLLLREHALLIFRPVAKVLASLL
jgi:hypothetical protein